LVAGPRQDLAAQVNPLPVTITARASADIEAISNWYERIRPELALRFRDDLDEVMEQIGERPTSFPEIEEGARRAICRTFPYKVYFSVFPNEVRVQAVYHVSRDPRKWDER
jgi:plasmid stabilization system protein ParE